MVVQPYEERLFHSFIKILSTSPFFSSKVLYTLIGNPRILHISHHKSPHITETNIMYTIMLINNGDSGKLSR